MTLSLNEDDELIMDVKRIRCGELNFQNAADRMFQSETLSLTSDFAQVKFVQKVAITKWLTHKGKRVISGYKENA